MTSLVKTNLPKHLHNLLLDIVPASGATRLSDVVESTLSSFIEAEEQEIRTTVCNLVHQLRTGGLAVVGTRPSFLALRSGCVDVLVMSKEYDPGPGALGRVVTAGTFTSSLKSLVPALSAMHKHSAESISRNRW